MSPPVRGHVRGQQEPLGAVEGLLGRADAPAQQQQHLLLPSPGMKGSREAARLPSPHPCPISFFSMQSSF